MKKLKLKELGRLDIEAFRSAEKLRITVVLDNIRSLHNVGSIFRTCDAFAIESIFLCGVTGTPPNREIYKTALGAEESVAWEHFQSTDLALEKLILQQYQIIAVEQTTQSIPLDKYTFEKGNAYALIFGNEVDGVSENILPLCHAAIEIPQLGTKHSFNVSISAGIVLWEAAKQISFSVK